MQNIINLFNLKTLLIQPKTLGRGLLYTFLSCLLVSIVSLLFVLSNFGFAGVSNITQKAKDLISKEYPDSLVVTMSDKGELSKNIAGPIYMFDSLLDDKEKSIEARNKMNIEHIVTFDDSKEADMSELTNYKTAVFVGKNGLIGKQRSGEIKAFDFNTITKDENFKGFSVNKTELMSWVDIAAPFIKWGIVLFALATLLLAPIFLSAMHLVWSVILAVIIMLILKLKGKYTYEESFLITLYAGVPAILVGSLLSLFINVTAMQSILTIVFVLSAIYLTKNNN
jgi:hypothetical protein